MDASSDINNLYISSSDTLCGSQTEQLLPPGWNDRPPLFVNKDNDQLLKGMIRTGIPPALRCAVWISNIIKACHVHQEFDYSEEYRTLGKARALDHAWNVVLKQTFADEDEITNIRNPPALGNDMQKYFYLHGSVPEKGQRSVALVLTAVQEVVGIDFCPLAPQLTALCLRAMSESYAFYALREMSLNSAWYFPVTPVEHHAWCKAFGDIVSRLHPHTAACMEQCGALSPEGLDPIFKHFFLPILRYEHVLRIMDIFTYEGSKVIFRFGVALVCLFKKDLKDVDVPSAEDFWEYMRQYTHHKLFNFEVLVKKAYGFHGRAGLRNRMIRFPRRHILARIIRLEEEKAMDELDFGQVQMEAPRPLGLVENDVVKLAKPTEYRANLAAWLPPTLRLNKLDLIYSTNEHGRTLDMFYRNVRNVKQTLLLCEVLDNNSIIGMYASQAWRISSKVYGDGECFLFRLNPDAKQWRWKPDVGKKSIADFDDPDASGNGRISSAGHTSLLEQFMVGRATFISMGGNEDGTSGFRLNEDLTKGESASAVGFNNEPLAGLDVFDIGLVEVYRFVRAVDGKTLEEVAAEAFTKMSI